MASVAGGCQHHVMTRLGLVLDCADPDGLAEFWAKALNTTVGADYGGEFVLIGPPSGSGPYLGLQKVPEAKNGKNRAHFDIEVPDEREAVDRLVDLGARVLWREDPHPHGWTVLAETDEEWEHTPQFHGFARPAMG